MAAAGPEECVTAKPLPPYKFDWLALFISHVPFMSEFESIRIASEELNGTIV